MAQPRQTLTAAASTYAMPRRQRRAEKKSRKSGVSWQATAWQWYDTIGEYRFAVAWVGNLLSKAKLVVARNDGKEVTDPLVAEALAGLFGGAEGQKEMLRQLGEHFTVAGEAYLIGEDGGGTRDDNWFVAASTSVSNNGLGWKIGERALNAPLVIRLWRPHPTDYDSSNSPSRAVLPILSEINGLTQHVSAQIDSRLAGAGMLLLPQEISFGSTQTVTEDGAAQDYSIDTFLAELVAGMETAVEDRSSPEALAPFVLQAPGEFLDKIKHLTFWSELDKQAIELRAEAIRRLALGMDMPPEALTGTGEMNHWGSWQMEEAAIKQHTEPLLQIITSSLTDGYLRPLLAELGVADAAEYIFTADTTAMRLRPNRSKEAVELYDRAELNAAALLRENGFDASDAMDEAERKVWLTKKVASGSTTPELVAEALRALGVNVTAPEPTAAEPTEGRPTPSLLEHPRRAEPDTLDDAAAAAAEVLVFRALERAGNRLKSKFSLKPEGVPAHELYMHAAELSPADIDDIMQDAWSTLPHFGLEGYTVALDSYARSVIRQREPYSRDGLVALMSRRARAA